MSYNQTSVRKLLVETANELPLRLPLLSLRTVEVPINQKAEP